MTTIHDPHESALIRRLSSYARPSFFRASFQLFNTGLPFLGMWVLMYFSLRWSYWLTLALALPTGFLLVRLFIFQHDCGHGSFFRQKWLNNWTGRAIGVLTLSPYQYWRRTHQVHHATSGDLERRGIGDVATLTVEEYRALSWRQRLSYRVVRNPVMLLGVGPIYQFAIKHRLPWDLPLSWKREWRSVWTTNAALVAVTVAMWLTLGLWEFLAVQVPIFLISGALGIYLFYVQHQFEDTYWERRKDWSFGSAALEGSSYFALPSWLHWLTGNIGIHHVHHLCSRIPNYRLRRVLRENPELESAAPRLTLWQSFRCLGLKLWDEEQRRLVGFREVRRQARRAAAERLAA